MTEPAGPALAPEAAIEDAAVLIRKAERAVVLTGAGISTPSGIPDFRSEGSGLWSHTEPMEVASLTTFRTTPERFFNWFQPLASQIFDAQPNPAHTAVADFERAGHVRAILTQNIDGLHQKAGSKNVIELHGTLRTFSCTNCFRQYDATPFLQPYIQTGEIPHCPNCDGILKPDVILFGEQLPLSAWVEAERAARQCDLMVVAGSSLEVLPVAKLPMLALDRAAHLIIINNTPTYLNARADVIIMDDVATTLPKIAKRVFHG